MQTAPPGFTPIPNSISGGFHKRKGNGWVYWYPDGKGVRAEPRGRVINRAAPAAPAPAAPTPPERLYPPNGGRWRDLALAGGGNDSRVSPWGGDGARVQIRPDDSAAGVAFFYDDGTVTWSRGGDGRLAREAGIAQAYKIITGTPIPHKAAVAMLTTPAAPVAAPEVDYSPPAPDLQRLAREAGVTLEQTNSTTYVIKAPEGKVFAGLDAHGDHNVARVVYRADRIVWYTRAVEQVNELVLNYGSTGQAGAIAAFLRGNAGLQNEVDRSPSVAYLTEIAAKHGISVLFTKPEPQLLPHRRRTNEQTYGGIHLSAPAGMTWADGDSNQSYDDNPRGRTEARAFIEKQAAHLRPERPSVDRAKATVRKQVFEAMQNGGEPTQAQRDQWAKYLVHHGSSGVTPVADAIAQVHRRRAQAKSFTLANTVPPPAKVEPTTDPTGRLQGEDYVAYLARVAQAKDPSYGERAAFGAWRVANYDDPDPKAWARWRRRLEKTSLGKHAETWMHMRWAAGRYANDLGTDPWSTSGVRTSPEWPRPVVDPNAYYVSDMSLRGVQRLFQAAHRVSSGPLSGTQRTLWINRLVSGHRDGQTEGMSREQAAAWVDTVWPRGDGAVSRSRLDRIRGTAEANNMTFELVAARNEGAQQMIKLSVVSRLSDYVLTATGTRSITIPVSQHVNALNVARQGTEISEDKVDLREKKEAKEEAKAEKEAERERKEEEEREREEEEEREREEEEARHNDDPGATGIAHPEAVTAPPEDAEKWPAVNVAPGNLPGIAEVGRVATAQAVALDAADGTVERARQVVRAAVNAKVGKLSESEAAILADAYERVPDMKALSHAEIEEVWGTLPSEGLEPLASFAFKGTASARIDRAARDWMEARDLTAKDVLMLAGVSDNARSVSVNFNDDDQGPHLSVEADFGVGRLNRTIRWNDERVEVHNDLYVLNNGTRSEDTPFSGFKMLLTEALALSRVRAAQGTYNDRPVVMTTYGAGDFQGSLHGSYNGYYTWAQLGYDLPDGVSGVRLPERANPNPPPPTKRETFRQLMSTQAGIAWWRVKGHGQMGYEFDTSPESYSMKRLEWYCRSRLKLAQPGSPAAEMAIAASLGRLRERIEKSGRSLHPEVIADMLALDIASSKLEHALRPALDAAHAKGRK